MVKFLILTLIISLYYSISFQHIFLRRLTKCFQKWRCNVLTFKFILSKLREGNITWCLQWFSLRTSYKLQENTVSTKLARSISSLFALKLLSILFFLYFYDHFFLNKTVSKAWSYNVPQSFYLYKLNNQNKRTKKL